MLLLPLMHRVFLNNLYLAQKISRCLNERSYLSTSTATQLWSRSRQALKHNGTV